MSAYETLVELRVADTSPLSSIEQIDEEQVVR